MIQVLEQRFPGDQGPTSCPQGYLDWLSPCPRVWWPHFLETTVSQCPWVLVSPCPCAHVLCPQSLEWLMSWDRDTLAGSRDRDSSQLEEDDSGVFLLRSGKLLRSCSCTRTH